MNPDPIVFAMANPIPEVAPEEAAPYARIIATGRSDYPNQINNVLCFPGLFRGALDVARRGDHRGDEDRGGARDRRRSSADDELREDYIIPSVFNRDVAPAVAAAVAAEARASGTAEAGAEVGFGRPRSSACCPGGRGLAPAPAVGTPRAPPAAATTLLRESKFSAEHGLGRAVVRQGVRRCNRHNRVPSNEPPLRRRPSMSQTRIPGPKQQTSSPYWG